MCLKPVLLNLEVHWSESCSVVSDSLRPHGLYSPLNSSGQNTGVGSLSVLQGIFPSWGSNPGLPHYRWILYQLSHEGSPRILEWAAYPLSRSSQPRNQTGVLPHCRQILYQLSYQGSPSQPGNHHNKLMHHHKEKSPFIATREGLHAAVKTQWKVKWINNFKNSKKINSHIIPLSCLRLYRIT